MLERTGRRAQRRGPDRRDPRYAEPGRIGFRHAGNPQHHADGIGSVLSGGRRKCPARRAEVQPVADAVEKIQRLEGSDAPVRSEPDASIKRGDVRRMAKTEFTRRALIGTACLLPLAGAPVSVAAQDGLRIDITRGQVEPMPIAITDFYGATPSDAQTGRDVAQVITANLERSGLFQPIDPRAFIQTPEALRVQPRFGDWRAINAVALVTGAASLQPDGRL